MVPSILPNRARFLVFYPTLPKTLSWLFDLDHHLFKVGFSFWFVLYPSVWLLLSFLSVTKLFFVCWWQSICLRTQLNVLHCVLLFYCIISSCTELYREADLYFGCQQVSPTTSWPSWRWTGTTSCPLCFTTSAVLQSDTPFLWPPLTLRSSTPSSSETRQSLQLCCLAVLVVL